MLTDNTTLEKVRKGEMTAKVAFKHAEELYQDILMGRSISQQNPLKETGERVYKSFHTTNVEPRIYHTGDKSFTR